MTRYFEGVSACQGQAAVTDTLLVHRLALRLELVLVTSPPMK